MDKKKDEKNLPPQSGEALSRLGELKLAIGSGAMLAAMVAGLGAGINGIATGEEPTGSPLVGSYMMHYDPKAGVTKDSDVCAAAYSIVEDAGTSHTPQIDIVGCATESEKLAGLPQGTRVRVEVHENGSVTTRPFNS